jgi:hypothetical protein
MILITQPIALIIVLSLAQALKVDAVQRGDSELNHRVPEGDRRSTLARPGIIHIMVRCPNGSNSREVLSEWVANTSIEAVAPLMDHWNGLAKEARKEVKCDGGQEAQIFLASFDGSQNKRAETAKPGLVQLIGQCPDGNKSQVLMSQEVPDTSLDKVIGMFDNWEDLIERARNEVRCADGRSAYLWIQESSHPDQ